MRIPDRIRCNIYRKLQETKKSPQLMHIIGILHEMKRIFSRFYRNKNEIRKKNVYFRIRTTMDVMANDLRFQLAAFNRKILRK